ncbi:MAG: HemK2/MTQ2 family protein methyltransferase [Thermoplasmata archaeon]
MLDARTVEQTGVDGIYPVREDSVLLAESVDAAAGERILEIGCGLGVASVRAARAGARVVSTDLNPFALRRLKDVAREESLDITPIRTDLANGLGRFDGVLCNPPYLPTTARTRDPDPWHNLALDGGPDGCRLLARVIATLPDHLRPGGRALVLVSTRQSPKRVASLLRRFRTRGGSVRTVSQLKLYRERLAVMRFVPPGT